MFAVPGWSISLSSLKPQTTLSTNALPRSSASAILDGTSISKSSTKRKRTTDSRKPKAPAVNSSNVSDLWESVIEGKSKQPVDLPSSKRRKVSIEAGNSSIKELNGNIHKSTKVEKPQSSENRLADSSTKGQSKALSKDAAKSGQAKELKNEAQNFKLETSELKKKEKKKKKQEQQKEDKGVGKVKHDHSSERNGPLPANTRDGPENSTAQPSILALPVKPSTKLTPLQASMRQKLISARFRHLNQTLYTASSDHSLSLFQSSPEMFAEYHEGFRKQVEVWPENPVDGYIAALRARGKLRGQQRVKNGAGQISQDVSPLPRTEGTCRVADLGCGEAALSSTLQPFLKKLHIKIDSFDLHSPSPLVTRADIANLPLADGSVDVAIFCLALMGTNWIDFIEEAFRVLRWKGELWVAEIKSRFARVGKSKRVEHSVGNRERSAGNVHKKQKIENAEDEEVAAVEVDGQDDIRQETDVGAFVEVLRNRGFVLIGEGQSNSAGAVDLSNKMFVKMQFVKGITPVKGKCVPEPKALQQAGSDTWKKKPKGKFIDNDAEGHAHSEASVLKPCVYKLR